MNIYFSAKEQQLTRTDDKIIAENSKNLLFACFSFDDSWAGLSKKAVFEYDGKAYSQLLNNDRCAVPYEVISAYGFYASLVGVDAENSVRMTSQKLKVNVAQGPSLDTEEPSEATLTEIEQLMDIALSVRADADNGLFNGKDGSDAAVTSANIKNALGYTPADKTQVDTNTNNIVGLQKEIERLTSAKAEGDTLEEQLAWLTANGDVTKEYLCADGYYYKAVYKEGGPLYTNLLPKATNADRTTIFGTDFNGDGVADGYKDGYRLNSSGEEKAVAGYMITGLIPCKDGDIIRIKGAIDQQTRGVATSSYSHNIVFYNSSNTMLWRTESASFSPTSPQSGWYFTTEDDGKILITFKTAEFEDSNAIANCDAFRFMAGSFENAIITVNEEIVEGTTEGSYEWQNTGKTTPSSVDYEDRIAKLEEDVEDLKNAETDTEYLYINPNIKCINHRGYYTAPENTLAAFRLSKQMGFTYVEGDIRKTSDGVVVMLHNETVDGTSNGTGAVSSLTFEQVRELDFGSWKSEEYAGEKIPTLEEFITLCKNLGLHPYIDIKAGFSAEEMSDIVTMIKRKGMQGCVTYITSEQAILGYVKDADPKARLGLIRSSETCISDSTITAATGLRTDTNEVFIDVNYETLNEEAIQRAVTNDFPVEAWTVPASAIPTLDPYITGYTSDDARANVVLYEYSK